MSRRLWVSEIKASLNELGGYATLEDIYNKVKERGVIDLHSYKDWKAQIRKHIYLHSSDCEIFKGIPGDETDIFYSIEGKGRGFWGLRNFKL